VFKSRVPVFESNIELSVVLQEAAPSDGKINTCTASSVCLDSPFKHERVQPDLKTLDAQ